LDNNKTYDYFIRKKGANMKMMLFILFLLGVSGGTAMADDESLIFDFSKGDKVNANGNSWEGFTDRVMGGVSEMSAGMESDGKKYYLRMKGKISLKNNGGFIQTRLFLDKNRRPFDASGYQGIAVTIKGAAGQYFLHLRTPANWFPWSFYETPLTVSGDWKRLEIPFTSFTGVSTMFGLEKNGLVSVAFFAGKQEFDADISVLRIEFY
jgi:hypothetical protein